MTFKLKKPFATDIYSGEAPIHWDEMIGENRPDLLIFKVSENYNIIDSQYKNYIVKAKELGIKYGLYHFLREDHTFAQAKLFIEAVKSVGGYGDVPPIVDVEIYPKVKGKNWAGQVKAFLDYVEEAFGVKPIIYTSTNFWKETFSRNILLQFVAPAWTKDYELWTAGYLYPQYLDANNTVPKGYIPNGWNEWGMWQYSEDGRKNGFPTNDLNLINQWFYDKYNIGKIQSNDGNLPSEENPVPSIPDTNINKNTMKYSVTASILNLRKEPTTSSLSIGKMKLNEVVEVFEFNSDKTWAHVKTSVGLEGWCSTSYILYVSGSFDNPNDPIDDPSVENDAATIEYPRLLETEELWGGAVTYKKYSIDKPRNATYHLMEINVDNVEFWIDNRVAVASTNNFLLKSKVQLAINGDGFYPQKGRTVMSGMNASKGIPYGTINREGALYISRDKKFSLEKPRQVWDAIGFPNLLIKNGEIVKINKALDDIRARTAIGVSKDQKTIYLLTVDGGDYAVKIGMNFVETAQILYWLRCDIGIMLDGGGSTTMVIEDESQKDGIRIINNPSGENKTIINDKTYYLRSVANHFGVKVK